MKRTDRRSSAEREAQVIPFPRGRFAPKPDPQPPASRFFQEPDALSALIDAVTSRLQREPAATGVLRAWIPACGEGEEAYSIAMLLIERLTAARQPRRIQIFATDANAEAVRVARTGVYPASIAAAVSPERLRRFFVLREDRCWQIGEELRGCIVFAPHDLLTDPPFSRLDLVCCRNVLNGLPLPAQENVLASLHFALRPGAYLLLGSAESADASRGHFGRVSQHCSLFRRIGADRLRSGRYPSARPRWPHEGRRLAPGAGKSVSRPDSWNEILDEILVREFAPASMLLNRRLRLLSTRGPVGNYLRFPEGKLPLVASGTDRHLSNRIHAICRRALREGRAIVDTNAYVMRDETSVPCTIAVRPLTAGANGAVLVVLQDRNDVAPRAFAAPGADQRSAELQRLEAEVQVRNSELQDIVEELETANAELQTSNDAMISLNAEVQLANDQLEASRGELRALNETLREKVTQLDRANNDLENFISASHIALLFLDRSLCIKRFTPAAQKLLRLNGAAGGRPLRDFAAGKDLLPDAERVMRTSQPVENEVCGRDNRWYLRRTRAYRNGEQRIDGVIVTFVDVTERMAAEAQVKRLAAVLQESNDALVVRNMAGQITAWNRGAERTYGYTEAEALKMNIRDLVTAQYRSRTQAIAQRVARDGRGRSFETQRRTRDGRVLDVWVTVTALRDVRGKPQFVATTERDITMRRHADEEIRTLNAELEQRVRERTVDLQASESRMRAILDATPDAVVTLDGSGRIITFNQAAVRMFGYEPGEAIGHNVKKLIASRYRDPNDAFLKNYRNSDWARLFGKPREMTARRKDGSEFPVQLSIHKVERLRLFVGFIHDLSAHKALQAEVLHIAGIEQRRIGQELHDGTQQELTGLGLLAQNLSETLRKKGSRRESELAARVAVGIEQTNRSVRALARGLVPPATDAAGLVPALHELAKDTSERHGLRCRFEGPETSPAMDDSAAVHVYRIAQEAVSNAAKHANAENVIIRLAQTDRDLCLDVRDDGIGIDRKAPTSGAGLRLMEHRCNLIGGDFKIENRRGGGTRVVCRVPKLARA